MKQTAVEWYGIQIGILISKFFNNEISKSEVHFKRIEIEEQAKEMEKQQIIDFSEKHILENLTCNYNGEPISLKEAEQYYNEKFNK